MLFFSFLFLICSVHCEWLGITIFGQPIQYVDNKPHIIGPQHLDFKFSQGLSVYRPLGDKSEILAICLRSKDLKIGLAHISPKTGDIHSFVVLEGFQEEYLLGDGQHMTLVKDTLIVSGYLSKTMYEIVQLDLNDPHHRILDRFNPNMVGTFQLGLPWAYVPATKTWFMSTFDHQTSRLYGLDLGKKEFLFNKTGILTLAIGHKKDIVAVHTVFMESKKGFQASVLTVDPTTGAFHVLDMWKDTVVFTQGSIIASHGSFASVLMSTPSIPQMFDLITFSLDTGKIHSNQTSFCDMRSCPENLFFVDK